MMVIYGNGMSPGIDRRREEPERRVSAEMGGGKNSRATVNGFPQCNNSAP